MNIWNAANRRRQASDSHLDLQKENYIKNLKDQVKKEKALKMGITSEKAGARHQGARAAMKDAG